MNTLLEGPGRMAHHTDLGLVFRALGGRQREFNWLITDLELNPYPSGLPYLPDVPRDQDRRWLSGAELTDIVEAHDVQFASGVLLGFRPGVALDLGRLEPSPYADGNKALWKPGVRIQHLAEVEIVCFDNTSTLLLSRDDDLSRRFRSFFPEAVDLDEHNRGRGRPVGIPTVAPAIAASVMPRLWDVSDCGGATRGR